MSMKSWQAQRLIARARAVKRILGTAKVKRLIKKMEGECVTETT